MHPDSEEILYREKFAEKIYHHFKSGAKSEYDEEKHCKILIQVMLDKNKGTHNGFCIHPDVLIAESTFWRWVQKYPFFSEIYYFSRMLARELWEAEGRAIRDAEYQIGTVNYSFEHWKLIGWSRFGVSKNGRLKLNLDPKGTPLEHYASIIKQATEGDFTASEFKQLMESVNVGLNVHEVFELQKQIDELKSNQELMMANQNVQNPFTNKGIEKKD